MPAARKGKLTDFIDSESEDTQIFEKTPTSLEEKAPAKRGHGRPKPLPTTKPKTYRPSASKMKAGESVTKKNGRAPLPEKKNQQCTNDTEEVNDLDKDAVMDGTDFQEAIPAVNPKRARMARGKSAAKAKNPKDIPATDYNLNEETPEAPQLTAHAPPKKKAQSKKVNGQKPLPNEVMESQIPEVEKNDGMNEELEETVLNPTPSAPPQQSLSRTRQPSISRPRAGSASDNERYSDPTIRKKLGEMTKKYENLHLKYRDLKELGLKEAERNFDKLKKQREAEVKASQNYITSLKADNTGLTKESQLMKKRLETQTSETTALEVQLDQLRIALSEAQSQNKALSTKLTANRTIAASVESVSSKIPGSANKSNGGIRMMGTAEAAQVAQAAQLKEDLYSDLTGLIIRSVKRETEDDIFDCIQTGRNGTLHFKLAAGNEKSAESFDDIQCSYTPQLDPSRDKMLIELLPDYLVDEITFPRPQAAKFYARVVKALTEKPA